MDGICFSMESDGSCHLPLSNTCSLVPPESAPPETVAALAAIVKAFPSAPSVA